MKYAVIVENAGPNWSAYSPDVPGCITTGPTYEETVANMREALHLHLQALVEVGQPLPIPHTRAIEIEAA